VISSRISVARREVPMAREIPYTAHVAAGVVCTRAGDYVQVFRLGGASFESADDDELNNWHERLNTTWRNVLSPNVAVWTHILRRRERATQSHPSSAGFAAALNRKYQDHLSGETLMVNEMFLSLVYRPMSGIAGGLANSVLSRKQSRSMQAQISDAVDVCDKLAQSVSASLARYEPEQLALYMSRGRWFSRVAEFFGVLINAEWQPMPLARSPMYDLLATTRPLFGTEVIEYRLPTRTRVSAVLGIKEYPTPTSVGMFNSLLSAPFQFVLTHSFAALGKATSQGLLQRQYNRMANAGDFAVSQAEELKDALDALTANEFLMGDHHMTLQILADAEDNSRADPASERLRRLNDDVALGRAMLADCGMTVAREDLAMEAAFWAQLPGCFALRPRKAPITSRNFAAMAPFHNYPAGRLTGNHWGDALALLISSARSPYYFSLHASDPNDPDGGSRKDTGHTFICGPTGSGKTVVIGFLVSLLLDQGASQVIFDKDYGLEILVRALGGKYFPLRNGERTGFNPLQLDPTPSTIEFQKSWLRMLARGAPLSTREQVDLDHALRGTLALERHARRLSRLIEFTDPTRAEGIHARLARWCRSTGGEYGWVFDNEEDSIAEQLSGQAIVGFDVTHFLENETLRGPINRYLFHLVEQLIDGRRMVCWVDEFSKALADPDFQSFADNAPKTWRKLNGALCVATQTASAVIESPIARTIVEGTATKIFFPNADAASKDYIDGFGLSEREFKLIKEQLEPGSRKFLVKQGHHSIVCQLDLKGFDAELAVISGRRTTVDEVRRLISDLGSDPQGWLPTFMDAHRKQR
jgi:type IV secretion system protein VirB4